MKFLIAIYKYFPYGGLQKDTYRVIAEAVRRGHNVTVMTTCWDDERIAGAEYLLVKPQGLTNTARMANFGKAFAERARDWQGSTLAMNRIPGADFYFVADACMKTALPAKRGFWFKKFLPRYRAILGQEAQVFAATAATRYLVLSEKQRQDFAAAYPDVPAERYSMLPPGIDERAHRHSIAADARARLRAECGAGDGDVLVVTVGTNLMLKGVDRVVKAVAQLPENVKYVVIGNDTPKRFEDVLARCGGDALRGRVRHIGPRRNVPDYLCAADMMVHLAREEGTGTVLLEAVSCGLPVLCTGVCGFAPYVAAVDAANVIAEPYNEEACVQRLQAAVGELAFLKAKTAAYAAENDFTKRTDAIVTLLERKAGRICSVTQGRALNTTQETMSTECTECTECFWAF